MERSEVLDMMGELKLYGMKAAYDETLATALKRQHEPQRFVGDLLRAEISEKQARSIKYQLTAANPSESTAARILTICRSPSSELACLRRTRSSAVGNTQSLNGAPLRSAPGLRASTGT